MENDSLDSIRQAAHTWEERVKSAQIAPVQTTSGVPIQPLYTPLDLEGSDYLQESGFPGDFPYTRGIHPLMYRSRLWIMRQYTGFGAARDTNQRNQRLIQEGVTGLSIAFDLPTQMGYDSDNPEIADEVGLVGVAVDSLEDFGILFDGIPLDQISTSFTINAITPIILAMYVAVGEKQGVSPDKLTGVVQNDILKEYVSRGAFIFPVGPAMRMIGDVFEYCAKEMPRFNPVSICGYHIREGGATAVQEIAICFANAIAYIENALQRGLSIDAFAPRLSFNLAAFMDLFEEVAKFRAARRLWARLLRDRFGAQDPRSWRFTWFAGTAGSTFTARQPENNIIRATIETLAIVLGGCQALTVNTKDEGHAIPTEESLRLALRTQQIVAYESGVVNTADPLGGRYFVEALTNQMEQEIEKAMAEIERRGGVVRCIEEGYIQRLLLEEAYKHARAVEKGERKIVGENCFVIAEEPPRHLHQPDPTAVQEQLARLADLKARRDNRRAAAALAHLRAAAQGTENIMPATLECVRAYATVGEMSGVLREVFGEFREPVDIF